MKPTILLLLFFGMSLVPEVTRLAQAQHPQPKEPEDIRLPSGKMQKDEILKADHEKTLEDAARLTQGRRRPEN